MNDSDYILLTISLLIGLASLVISSRKSGYIISYKFSFRDRYVIDRDKIGYFCKGLLLIVVSSIMVGLFFSQDILTVFEFTAINTFFAGYALAWEKIIKLK